MARIPRLVVPGFPHHVTQRGNRRMKTFFCPEDYQAYLDLLLEVKDEVGAGIWAYCLMPNHVHIVVVPEHENSLAKLFRHVHRHYTRRVNFRERWRGHLWQERFHSFVMDEQYLMATVRYTELNPVRAGLCELPEDWPWSSVHAHLAGGDDSLVTVRPMLGRINDWRKYLSTSECEEGLQRIRQHAGTGRPAGDGQFLDEMEALSGRKLRKGKPGPRP